MSNLAEMGYGQVTKQTASPRHIEYKILTSIAAEIEKALQDQPASYRALVVAINRNTQLWTSLAADLMHPDNKCEPKLKADLISLANFSISQGLGVVRGDVDGEVLVEINRTIAKGLKPLQQAAA